jgi:23S rRNA (pseudouridine1915-N3)-methyltransferase
MRVSLIAVGRLKDKAERGLAERYVSRFDRVGGGIGFGPVEQIELGESRKESAAGRRAEEASAMLARVPTQAKVVALDVEGEQLASEEFAALMGAWRDGGVPRSCFLIGGPDGHGEAVAGVADLTLSLGRITLPHGLARIVLAEQLYRAATILAGHPYHRA